MELATRELLARRAPAKALRREVESEAERLAGFLTGELDLRWNDP